MGRYDGDVEQIAWHLASEPHFEDEEGPEPDFLDQFPRGFSSFAPDYPAMGMIIPRQISAIRQQASDSFSIQEKDEMLRKNDQRLLDQREAKFFLALKDENNLKGIWDENTLRGISSK